jgi:predicted DNA-binding transcriptional regulator AlpA
MNNPIARRLLSRQEAATYCSLSSSAFSLWVKDGRLPSALPGTSRWDLKAIDIALDAMSGLQPRQESSALDEWRALRARRA